MLRLAIIQTITHSKRADFNYLANNLVYSSSRRDSFTISTRFVAHQKAEKINKQRIRQAKSKNSTVRRSKPASYHRVSHYGGKAEVL